MNTSELGYQIAVMQAAMNGKKIECRRRRVTTSIPDTWDSNASVGSFNWYDLEYRVKPQPELVPWTQATAPLPGQGVLFRHKGGLRDSVWCLNVRNEYSLIFNRCEVQYSIVLREYEHSTDAGKTWKPCGTEVLQ